jgi:hypothetical protein
LSRVTSFVSNTLQAGHMTGATRPTPISDKWSSPNVTPFQFLQWSTPDVREHYWDTITTSRALSGVFRVIHMSRVSVWFTVNLVSSLGLLFATRTNVYHSPIAESVNVTAPVSVYPPWLPKHICRSSCGTSSASGVVGSGYVVPHY